MKRLQDLTHIAWQVRRVAIKIYRYNTDLGGCCANCSVFLFEMAWRAGIRCRLVYNDSHCFVMYRNHIVDVTATQFGRFPAVTVKKYSEVESRRGGVPYWWKKGGVVSCPTKLRTGRAWPGYSAGELESCMLDYMTGR
jgi:hypothetical protein